MGLIKCGREKGVLHTFAQESREGLSKGLMCQKARVRLRIRSFCIGREFGG